MWPATSKWAESHQSAYRDIKHVTKQEKTKDNDHKILIFAGQNKELYPHIMYHFKACIMKNLNLQ